MKRNKKCDLLLILFIFTVTFSEAFASGGNMNCQLEYLNHKLSVNAEKVPLSFLLSKIQEKTGIKNQLPNEESDRMISVRFHSLSIDRALGKILSNLNHAIISGPEGKIQEVIIVGKNNKLFKSQNQQTFKAPASSNVLNMGLPDKGGMKIHQSSKKMMTRGTRNQHSPDKTNTAPDGMITTNSSGKINTPPNGMIINNSPGKTNTTPDGMKTTNAPNNMIVEPPSGEGMTISQSSTPTMMNLSSKGGGMKITYSSRKMVIRQ